MMILLIEAGLLFAILFGIVWFITTKIRQFGLEKAVKVYQGSEVNLSGTGTNAEKLAADASTTWVSEETNTVDRAYTLYFEKDALNQWQGAQVDISVDVSAVQYANTAAGDATLNIDTGAHTVATNAGVNTVEMARELVKTDDAGKVVS